MKKQYLLCLYKQFCDAYGLDFSSRAYINSKEFYTWIAANKEMINTYAKYLEYLRLNFLNDDSAEVGKGDLDSIATPGMGIISDFNKNDRANLFVFSACAYVINDVEMYVPMQKLFITHNPYDSSDLLQLITLHNSGSYKTNMGMFGDVHDENVKQKLAILEAYSKKMKDEFVFDKVTDQGCYYATLSSKTPFEHQKVHCR